MNLCIHQYQRKWLNEYNRRCEDETGTYLKSQNKMAAYEWLRMRTAHIPEVPVWSADPDASKAAMYSCSSALVYGLIFVVLGRFIYGI